MEISFWLLSLLLYIKVGKEPDLCVLKGLVHWTPAGMFKTSVKLNKLTRGSPKLNTVCVYGHTAQFIYIKDFAWELLDRVIYKTLHGSPLDFSKIYILMNDELTLTYLKCLACTSLSVLCSLGSIWSDLSLEHGCDVLNTVLLPF